MITPKILVSDIRGLVKYRMYSQAVKWLAFCLFSWAVYLPWLLFIIPLALTVYLAESFCDFVKFSAVGRFYSGLDDIEDAWREELRKEYRKRKGQPND